MATKRKASSRRKVKSIKPAPPVIDHLTGAEYINREFGALEFNARVLAEVDNIRYPLLERVRFLSIFSSNLDEFFMKRVGGLKRQVSAGIATRSPDGLEPQTNLRGIRGKVLPLLGRAANAFEARLVPELAAKGVGIIDYQKLEPKEKEWADFYFKTNIFPVLTPLAIDPGHPFPFLSNLSISIGVIVKHPDRDENLFARVKVPQNFPLWLRIDNPENAGRYRFLNLLSLIQVHLKSLFPHMEILGSLAFRITRNADVERDEEDAEDLLEMIEEELRMRRFAKVIRFEHGPNPEPSILKFLMEELELIDDDIYELSPQLDFSGLSAVADLQLADLHFPNWAPQPPIAFADEQANVFDIIRHNDILVHHPYESFSGSVERFLRAAVDDPKVLAIKMTMYRLGDQSPLVPLLIEAAEQGKQVVCLIELKARFDEARNIHWAQELEKAGVHVVYGIVGLKTHAKLLLVIREEAAIVRSYAHIGTGNYHAQTARLYTDFGLFTSKESFTSDVVELFHFLTGRSLKKDYSKLLVAPINMREKFLTMIEREMEHARRGRPAGIIVKCNSLEDQQFMKKLYQASQAGVSIELLIRGFCCLRPQVQGLSQNIRVRSVVGRFLEHSRAFYFRNGAKDQLDGEFYIGSGDWMYRNLTHRVEATTPIEDRVLKEKIWNVFQSMMTDSMQTWNMKSDGSYERAVAVSDASVGVHELIMSQTRDKWKAFIEQRQEKNIETHTGSSWQV